MELIGLFNAMGYQAEINNKGKIIVNDIPYDRFYKDFERKLQSNNTEGMRILGFLKDTNNPKIKIPSNLSILATINTSDESIYYLDSAFKRRWDWEYIEISNNKINYNDIPKEIRGVKLIFDFIPDIVELDWSYCIVGLNDFIKDNHQIIRRIEDKQIGWWFIKPENNEIREDKVKNKLMFYLWDTIFTRDKKPLETVLKKVVGDEKLKLVTYGDFILYSYDFMEYLYKRGSELVLFTDSGEIDESSSVGF